MTDQLISFETAKLAKEKGFNQVYLNLTTPELVSQSLLQRWLREVHGIRIEIGNYDRDSWYPPYPISKNWGFHIHRGTITQQDGFSTYELALEAGLVEALTIVTKPF